MNSQNGAPKTESVATRIPSDLAEEVDKILEGLNKTLPAGAKLKRGDIIRVLIMEALEARRIQQG